MKRPYKPYLCFCSKCERNDIKENLDISKILTTKKYYCKICFKKGLLSPSNEQVDKIWK